MAIGVWVLAFLIGQFVTLGIPAINSLVSAGILYWLGMKILGALRRSEDGTEFKRTTQVA